MSNFFIKRFGQWPNGGLMMHSNISITTVSSTESTTNNYPELTWYQLIFIKLCEDLPHLIQTYSINTISIKMHSFTYNSIRIISGPRHSIERGQNWHIEWVTEDNEVKKNLKFNRKFISYRWLLHAMQYSQEERAELQDDEIAALEHYEREQGIAGGGNKIKKRTKGKKNNRKKTKKTR